MKSSLPDLELAKHTQGRRRGPPPAQRNTLQAGPRGPRKATAGNSEPRARGQTSSLEASYTDSMQRD